MKLKDYLNNRSIRKLLIAGLLIGFILVILSILHIDIASIRQLTIRILGPYFTLAEIPANCLAGILADGVSIKDHMITYSNNLLYYDNNRAIIDNWRSYLLFLKWIAFLLLCFWLTESRIQKKLIYTGLLIVTHYISVIIGLVMFAGIGPLLADPESFIVLVPHLFGTLAMFALFVVWLKRSLPEIRQSLKRITIDFNISRKKINEILIVCFTFLLLRNFIISYFNFYGYINFLLVATQNVVAVLGYNSVIDGHYITGDNNGSLFMAKWCLGLMTMFVFSAMVFLTREKNRSAWIYIGIGIIILHIFNILRLSVLFIFVQYYDDSELILDHHTMYNIVVYLIIFVMWIVWFERYTSVRKKAKV